MINLFVGIDVVAAKAKARNDATGEVVVFGEGEQPFETALAYLHSQGLFSPHLTLIFDRALESAEGKNLFKESAGTLHTHPAQVFVIETALSAEDKKLFPKGITPVDFGKKETEERLLPFALSDAFLRGDRKGAWVEYHKLLLGGVSPEEIHGTLSWGVRSALIALKTKSAAEAGLKPFVYTKSKRVGEQRGVENITQLSRSLVAVYHRARAGAVDMTLGMEGLILEKN